MEIYSFGKLADGREVRAAALSSPNGELRVEVLEYGAHVRRITVGSASGPIDVASALGTLSDYEADTAYHGPIVGRCANRIGRARFEIDGQTYRVSANEGANCLHGGRPGFDKRLWRFEAPAGGERVALAYVSPDGEEGFPGRVHVRAIYDLVAPDTLEIRYEATTDRATPVNLSQHLYFNLSGDAGSDILDHRLKIGGDAITPVGPNLIPTGELMAVSGTPFDLRTPRRIGDALQEGHPQLVIAKGFDHNWALDPDAAYAFELRSPASGLALTVETDQPGLQVYSGQGLQAPFVKHGAIVFEPQGFPDAVNQPGFPEVVLRPGQLYSRRSRYRFTRT